MKILRNMLLRNLIILCIACWYATGTAQENLPGFWEHVHFGGGVGLSFGDGFFSGTLAPGAVYEFNEQFALGIGASFSYNRQKNLYETTIAGGSILTLYNIIPELQASAEFEQLNVSRKYDAALQLNNDNYWYPALFLGAGYRAGNVTMGVRYDILYNENKSIYATAWMPFARVYF